MKCFKFSCLLLLATMTCFLTSCGGNREKTTTETTADTSATVSTPSKTTIITSPENMMVVRHKISNYAKFEAAFNGHDSMRLVNGIHKYVIGRGVEDSNSIMVALKVDDMAKAKAFSKDASLKAAMQKAGVVGAPTFMFITMVYQDTATLSSGVRAMNTFTVRDWDAWKKAFESNRQLRIDNGLSDRAYGYDVDDNHKVILAVAINDSAKANAFWKSDLIKQKRAESGVIGQPQRFLYRVVQRY